MEELVASPVSVLVGELAQQATRDRDRRPSVELELDIALDGLMSSSIVVWLMGRPARNSNRPDLDEPAWVLCRAKHLWCRGQHRISIPAALLQDQLPSGERVLELLRKRGR